MAIFSHIKLKALFMLTVFTVNLYAICHCHHNAAHQAKTVIAHCSHCHKEAPAKEDNDGCCGTHAVQFNHLDKMAVKGIAVATPPAQDLVQPIQFSVPALDYTATRSVIVDWQQKHIPPDLLSLHQCYRI